MWSRFDWLCRRLRRDGRQRLHPFCGCRSTWGIVYLSETSREALKPELSSLWRCVVKQPNHYGAHYVNMIEVGNYVQLKYIQAYRVHLSPYYSVYLYCREQNIWGHFISPSVTLSLAPLAIILGIKCHCFDTIAQTQKWFLKGDRAISLLLDLWGWRGPACLSEQKRRWWQGLTPPSKNHPYRSTHNASHPPNSHTQTHTSSGEKKLPEGAQTFMLTAGIFSVCSNAVT